jgi:acyl dehydratase
MNAGPLHYEDLDVGQRWRTAARTVTEADIVAFAGVSGDFNPIHVDAEHAATTRFGERIAHGALVLAIATGLRQQQNVFRGTLKAWLGCASGASRPRCGSATRSTSSPRSRSAARPRTRRQGLVVQAVEVHNQRDEVVASGEFVTLMARRPPALAEALP